MVLVSHGLVHLIGFVVPWQVAAIEGFAYRTTILNGTLEIGDSGARLVGAMWLALAIGFGVTACGLSRRQKWTPLAAGLVASGSLVVCLLGLPETATGVLVNAAILALLGFLAMTGRATRSGQPVARSLVGPQKGRLGHDICGPT